MARITNLLAKAFSGSVSASCESATRRMTSAKELGSVSGGKRWNLALELLSLMYQRERLSSQHFHMRYDDLR
jgi:hypothetical protein